MITIKYFQVGSIGNSVQGRPLVYIKLSANVEKVSTHPPLCHRHTIIILLILLTFLLSFILIVVIIILICMIIVVIIVSEKSAGADGEICWKHARQRGCEYFSQFFHFNFLTSKDEFDFACLNILSHFF